MRSSLPLVPLLLLAGCKVLVPYDNEFACAKSQDYGRCMDVQSAYEDARAGTAPVATPASRERHVRSAGPRAPVSSPPTPSTELRGALIRELAPPVDAAERLRDARYRELAGLIEDPVTPLVRAPKVLRTLIVSYRADETLYMPRYVYYIAEDTQFVLGDYLQAAPPERTMYPNGGPAQRSTP